MQFVDYTIDEKAPKPKEEPHALKDAIREQLQEYSKDFKTSWVNLGRHLYAVWQDKMFYGWGFNKFENYTEEELGINKPLCIKLLKTYAFIEQEKPEYLENDFGQEHDSIQVPGYEAVNVLRMAKQKKEILRDDYAKLKKDVFEKGKDAGEVRKDLASIMKERKIVDPDEERDKRNEVAIKKVLSALDSFEKDMAVLKLLPDDIVSTAKELREKLATHI